MNWALWKKTIHDCRWLLLSCIVMMFAFHWLEVWLTSKVKMAQLKMMLDLLPDFAKNLLPVPVYELASTSGRIAVAYAHPIVLLLVTIWAIARGSDAVSGELGRGTLEMVLAQPVTRSAVLMSQAAVTVIGAVLICTAAWLGTAVGLAVCAQKLEEPVTAAIFLPAALNLLALTVFLAGLTTMVSSVDRYRWRTIGIVGGFYAVEMVVKLVGRSVPEWNWLTYCSFFSAYEPQPLVWNQELAWSWVARTDSIAVWGGLSYHAVLIGLGFACYALAIAIFSRRDLPAPL